MLEKTLDVRYALFDCDYSCLGLVFGQKGLQMGNYRCQ